MKQFMQLLYNDKKHYEEFIENQIETLGVTAKQYMYPNIDALIPNKKIADLLIPLMNGDEEFDASELTAILLYTSQKQEIEKYSDVFLSISLSEMYHYDSLQELIKKLGGKITQIYQNKVATKLGSSPKEALQIAIESENQTIENLDKVINELITFKEYPQRNIIIQFLSKIKEDEKVHLSIFQKHLVNESVNDLRTGKSEIIIDM